MLDGKGNVVFVVKPSQVAKVLGVYKATALAGQFDRAVLLVMRSRRGQTE